MEQLGRVCVAGIAAINMDWLVKFTEKYIKKLSGDYMCVSNVNIVLNYMILMIEIPGPRNVHKLGRQGFKEYESMFSWFIRWTPDTLIYVETFLEGQGTFLGNI